MNPEERHERFERALAALIVANLNAPVLVEGNRDARALRELGLKGEILVYNRGQTMAAFTQGLLPQPQIVALFDWDRKGGQLTRLLQQHCAGGPRLDLDFRKEFARVSLVKCVEDLPAALRTVAKRAEEHEVQDEGS